MKGEPLKDKVRHAQHLALPQVADGWKVYIEDDVKSALEWMIAIHEEKIETAISVIKGERWHPTMRIVIDFINNEYEAIMILEEGLSDVI